MDPTPATATLIIDGQEVSIREREQTLLELATQLGIHIPTLCHHPALSPYGACRLCLVEVKKRKRSKLVTACLYPAEGGIEVDTRSEKVLKTRRMIMELLLARCPDSRPLQDLARQMGVHETRFNKKYEDCVLCGLCVRVCQERMGRSAINFAHRGAKREVLPPFAVPNEVCQTCGACYAICPLQKNMLPSITANEPKPIPSEFNLGLGSRSPIYIPYPQGVPNAATIDERACVHFLQDGCAICQESCEAEAIDFTQEPETSEVNVGSIVLSPGYEPLSPDVRPELGFGRYANVMSALQFERMLSASGPSSGKVVRPSDHQPPKKVAWIQCVGSRDVDHKYCSSVCCMYATKEAIIAKEHEPDLACTVFFMEMRAYGKGFDAYYNRARELGVKYVRCAPSSVKQVPGTTDLRITYETNGRRITEEFDLVVLSTGFRPPHGVQQFADTFGIGLTEHRFAATRPFGPVETSRPGIYASGPFTGPKDIPETVMEASASASAAMALLAAQRGEFVTSKEYPPEKDVRGQEPRIGVFVCHCGKNIGGVADVPSVVEYARTLPNVVFADDNLYTCSTDTQKRIRELIAEQDLNRVVVASCSPRTHEPLFRNTCREAGLNEYLFEMANIRDQCTWVHKDEPERATRKSKDLLRMAVAKARLLEPLVKGRLKVKSEAVVVGGGMAGMTAALNLADQGFPVHLVEQGKELGGNLRHVHRLLHGADPQQRLAQTVQRVTSHPRIHLYLESTLASVDGSVGNFRSTITCNGRHSEVAHGVAIIATGASEHQPTEYLYGQHPRVLTQRELEASIATDDPELQKLASVVMIQCVGSRDEVHPYCSRVCCAQAVKNAIALKEIHPDIAVQVLYRDIRTYGLLEEFYTHARRLGVRFIRYEEQQKPQVTATNGHLQVSTVDPVLDAVLGIDCDLLVLAPAIVPRGDAEEVGKLFKVALNQDKFFLEAHMKLRPVDFATEGVFMCGLAHSPKSVEESIAQAQAAAAKAATILSQDEIALDATISELVDDNCDGCAYCIDPCPFNALTLIEYMYNGNIKKAVDRDAALCKGCGVCQATCPKQGIFIRNFRLDQLSAMVDAALVEA
ncbi:MAG: FAD-dependent oxidoreductase [Gemmatimonadales bacterium]|nr:FAD-dependent oxidoreductase [Gemmatimonadales bacterium]